MAWEPLRCGVDGSVWNTLTNILLSQPGLRAIEIVQGGCSTSAFGRSAQHLGTATAPVGDIATNGHSAGDIRVLAAHVEPGCERVVTEVGTTVIEVPETYYRSIWGQPTLGASANCSSRVLRTSKELMRYASKYAPTVASSWVSGPALAVGIFRLQPHLITFQTEPQNRLGGFFPVWCPQRRAYGSREVNGWCLAVCLHTSERRRD